MRLTEDAQQVIADQLAQFLKELHGVPINQIADFEVPSADALMTSFRFFADEDIE